MNPREEPRSAKAGASLSPSLATKGSSAGYAGVGFERSPRRSHAGGGRSEPDRFAARRSAGPAGKVYAASRGAPEGRTAGKGARTMQDVNPFEPPGRRQRFHVSTIVELSAPVSLARRGHEGAGAAPCMAAPRTLQGSVSAERRGLQTAAVGGSGAALPRASRESWSPAAPGGRGTPGAVGGQRLDSHRSCRMLSDRLDSRLVLTQEDDA